MLVVVGRSWIASCLDTRGDQTKSECVVCSLIISSSRDTYLPTASPSPPPTSPLLAASFRKRHLNVINRHVASLMRSRHIIISWILADPKSGWVGGRTCLLPPHCCHRIEIKRCIHTKLAESVRVWLRWGFSSTSPSPTLLCSFEVKRLSLID